MYYYHWTPQAIESLTEQQYLEAWQNLVWIREEEAKAQKKAQKR